MWNAGNVLSILATNDLSYAVACKCNTEARAFPSESEGALIAAATPRRAPPRLHASSTDPLFQSSLFVAGLWGMFLFGELPERAARLTFAVGGAVLTSGAALLAQFA